MMKQLFVVFLILISLSSYAQNSDVKVYHFNELPEVYDADTIQGLSFSKLKLHSLPDALRNFHNLLYLDLSKNRIQELNEVILSSENLESLNLERNRLDRFPNELCRLSSLKSLVINQNVIESIPNCIELLDNLEYLDLYDNPVRQLPEGLLNMDSIKKIDLSGIRFSPTFQESWKEKLPNVELIFDAPCDCME